MNHDPRATPPPLRLAISARWVAALLAVIAIAMCAIDWLGKLVMHKLGYKLPGLINRTLGRFDVDHEATIPTWFNSLLLLAASVLLVINGLVQRRQAGRGGGYWFALAGVMLYLALDEAAEIHENVINHIPVVLIRLFGGSGAAFEAYERIFPWYWVLPGAVLVLVVGLLFLRWVLSLPRTTRLLFIAAGAVFVTGALGMEFLASHYVTTHGRGNMRYMTLATAEELLEMLGVILLIYALLRHLATTRTQVIADFR